MRGKLRAFTSQSSLFGGVVFVVANVVVIVATVAIAVVIVVAVVVVVVIVFVVIVVVFIALRRRCLLLTEPFTNMDSTLGQHYSLPPCLSTPHSLGCDRS